MIHNPPPVHPNPRTRRPAQVSLHDLNTLQDLYPRAVQSESSESITAAEHLLTEKLLPPRLEFKSSRPLVKVIRVDGVHDFTAVSCSDRATAAFDEMNNHIRNVVDVKVVVDSEDGFVGRVRNLHEGRRGDMVLAQSCNTDKWLRALIMDITHNVKRIYKVSAQHPNPPPDVPS